MFGVKFLSGVKAGTWRIRTLSFENFTLLCHHWQLVAWTSERTQYLEVLELFSLDRKMNRWDTFGSCNSGRNTTLGVARKREIRERASKTVEIPMKYA